MGCTCCASTPLEVIVGAAPLPLEGEHKMRVLCTGRSLKGKLVRKKWNSNTRLKWKVFLPRRSVDGVSDCDQMQRESEWFYVTTSTDLYHFGVFKDVWAEVWAYGSKTASAAILVQLCEKEKILRFILIVDGAEQMTIIRVGVGPTATMCVEPADARAGDFAWQINTSGARRMDSVLLTVSRGVSLESFELVISADSSDRPPQASAILIFLIGFILGSGFLRSADIFLRTGLAEDDAR